MKKFLNFFLLFLLSLLTINVVAQDKSPANGLSMKGWDVATNPNVNNSTSESGTIVYAIELDSLGNLISATVIKKEVSDELAQKCLDEICKMKFDKNKYYNAAHPGTSKGTITFIFKLN